MRRILDTRHSVNESMSCKTVDRSPTRPIIRRPHAKGPPNFIIVLADDMGACDLGAYGNEDAETPNIDALAARSVRHEAFYVTPVCAPTRAALLTGRHHLRTGVAGVHGGKDHINLSETLLPEFLKQAGYATGIWGKWHSGNSEGYLPHQRGFDEALRLRLYKHRDPRGHPNDGEALAFDGRWADDVIVEHALDFAVRNHERPFFGLVSSMTPHGPLDAPEAEIERFMRDRKLSRNVATLHAQMAGFDRAVGRLVDGLEKLDTGGRETILLFLSDNGPAMFEDGFDGNERARRNVLGWRGWKGDVWEAGIRTPLYICRIGNSDTNANGVVEQAADATDILPTLLALAGIDADTSDKPLDGRDIRPMLRGEAMPEKPIFSWVHPAIPPAPGRGAERRLQDEYGPVSPEAKAALRADEQVMALRIGDWKLARNADINRPGGPHPPVFFGNVAVDPRETTDLAEREPARAGRFGEELDAWFAEIRREPQSFRPPQLQMPARGEVRILASWAAYVSPSLHNGVPATEGFRSAGQQVRWSLNVATTRRMIPRLVWFREGRLPPHSRLALRAGDAEIFGTVDENGAPQWEGGLMLDAGPGSLELEILEIPPLRDALDLLFIDLLPPPPSP